MLCSWFIYCVLGVTHKQNPSNVQDASLPHDSLAVRRSKTIPMKELTKSQDSAAF